VLVMELLFTFSRWVNFLIISLVVVVSLIVVLYLDDIRKRPQTLAWGIVEKVSITGTLAFFLLECMFEINVPLPVNLILASVFIGVPLLIVDKVKNRKSTETNDTAILTINFDKPLETLADLEEIENHGGSTEQLFKKMKSDITSLVEKIATTEFSTRQPEDTSYSICIDAKWGSGKTSFMNITKTESINRLKNKLVWIDYNPWNFGNENELIQDFFNTLNSGIYDKHGVKIFSSLNTQ